MFSRNGSCSRTTRSNSRSPWITCVAAVPPIAVSMSVLTSDTFSPYCAMRARSGSMIRLGCPSSRTSVMPEMPGTVASVLRTASALPSSVSSSGPKILTASELLRPVDASSTASSAGCVKLKMMPGKASSFFWIAATSCSFVRMSPRHAGSSYGFRPTKYSSLKKPIGSVPSSSRPSSLATVVTCGKPSSASRTCGPSFEASSKEIV